MNKRIIVSGFLSLSFTLCAMAQMDNVVEVENDYKPTVKDANKINLLPDIEQTQVNHYNVNYTTTALPSTSYVFQPMWAARNEQLIRGDKKGFATLGYGTNNNVLGHITYGFDMENGDEVTLEASSRGHKGNIDHASGLSEWESRFFKNAFRLGYKHHMNESSSLLVTAGYGTEVFNYQAPTTGLTTTDKQHNDLLDASIQLTPYSFGRFAIGAKASFASFAQKYVTSLADEAKETQFGAEITPMFALDAVGKSSIDLQLGIENISFAPKTIEGYTSFSAAPHFNYSNVNVSIHAGAFINNEKEIAPDVDFVWHITPGFDLYLMAQGGEVKNDFREFSQFTPYWALPNVSGKLNYQFDRLRARGGVRVKPSTDLYFDLGAGYTISKNRAEIADFLMSETDPTYAPLLFADGKQMFANARLNYNLNNKFKANLSGQFNVWSTDFNPNDHAAFIGMDTQNWDKVTWRPQVEADCQLMFLPVEPFVIGVDFLFQSFKKEANRYVRDNMMNLNASLSYTLPCRLTIFAKGDNLLNKKYDQYTMYRTPGMSFLFGAALTF